MSLLGAPLPSATYAGTNNGYYAPRDSGGALVGVQSLNTYVGVVQIVGDTSVGVTNLGAGAIQVSTNGKAQNVTSLAVSGNISGGSGMTLVGSLQSAGVTTGGVTCVGVTSTGPIATAGANDVTSSRDVIATSNLTASGFGQASKMTTVAVPAPANGTFTQTTNTMQVYSGIWIPTPGVSNPNQTLVSVTQPAYVEVLVGASNTDVPASGQGLNARGIYLISAIGSGNANLGISALINQTNGMAITLTNGTGGGPATIAVAGTGPYSNGATFNVLVKVHLF